MSGDSCPEGRTARASRSGRILRCETGLTPQADGALEHVLGPVDTMIVTGGLGHHRAGVTGALDLTLSFIEDDHGVPLARQVARNLVTYLQRPGNQAQMSLFTGVTGEGNDTVQQAIGFIATHLDADLSTAAVADHVGVSSRHLTRLFDTHPVLPPARFVREARIDAAARLLEASSLPAAAIAQRCGFGSAEALRQSFVGRYGISPTDYRARFSRPPRPVPTS